MDKQAIIRRMRIAVSVFFGVLTVALCVLWVRSYTGTSGWRLRVTHLRRVIFDSRDGRLSINAMKLSPYPTVFNSLYDSVADESLVAQDRPAFQVHTAPMGVGCSCQYWLLVVIAASTATAPWLRRRFSLRTMLIATTLVAVVLGLVCYAVR